MPLKTLFFPLIFDFDAFETDRVMGFNFDFGFQGAAYLAERLRPKDWNAVASPFGEGSGAEPGSGLDNASTYDADRTELYFGLLRDTDTRLNESGFYATFFTNDNNASVQLRTGSLTPAEENRTRGGKLIFAEPRERMAALAPTWSALRLDIEKFLPDIAGGLTCASSAKVFCDGGGRYRILNTDFDDADQVMPLPVANYQY